MDHNRKSPAPSDSLLARCWPLLTVVCWLACGAVLQAEEQLPLKKLDGATRAKVFASLTGLVILGVFLVLFAVWGANFTRRYMRSGKKFGPTQLPGDEDWTSTPIVPRAGTGDSPRGEG